ncbi:CmcI family methyltransferase [Agrobacterium sp. lyk4-40-TYG-31]|uniref:cephalosporin hydroxylase family protein n=1 Tax=Agrobacterium sp. lyk4-40-TYG-31 TaxID=3040276 RepID=UPI00254A513D|nr:CmcI family methyltransferase [Agrobacterium sp. lyk4-40-TYG-31]
MAKDDRQQFRDRMLELSSRLGEDKKIEAESVRLFKQLNKYDYSYLWTWMGVPIIQLPPDIIVTQEAIWATRPDVIVDVGVARGGSVIFMASILAALGDAQSKVIGVDIDIRAHNRKTIEDHPLSTKIQLVEGHSLDSDIYNIVASSIPSDSRVMVVLDSNHSYEHVLEECRLYSSLVSEGCYLVVTNTILGRLDDDDRISRSSTYYKGNDPLTALRTFLLENNNFAVDGPLNGKLIFSQSFGGFCMCRKQTDT